MTASTERASPLSEWESAFRQASGAAADFRIREVPFGTQIDVRGDTADSRFQAAIRSATGCELPGSPNTWTAGRDGMMLWLGPDEWLLLAEEGRNEALAAALRAALGSLHHCVTDVSASRAAVEVSGEHARVVLAKGCPLDLHSRSFGPGQCAQTLLAKARVLIQCRDDRPTFRLFVLNSFASYLAQWLLDAAAECAASKSLDASRIAARLA